MTWLLRVFSAAYTHSCQSWKQATSIADNVQLQTLPFHDLSFNIKVPKVIIQLNYSMSSLLMLESCNHIRKHDRLIQETAKKKKGAGF